jgi:phosphate transport system protein
MSAMTLQEHTARAFDTDIAGMRHAVDDLRDALVETLVARMGREPHRVAQALDLILVVQSIERIADHAESVAEYVVNVVQGVDTRHGNLPA